MPTDGPPLTVVIASNSQAFRTWCRDTDRRALDSDVEYVDLGNVDVVTAGWKLRRGIDEIVDLGGDPELRERLEALY